MATKDEPLPETMISPETRETLTRGVRPFAIAYKGESVVVDLPGYYPTGEAEGVHIGKDMAVVDQALRGLKEKADGVHREKRSGVCAPSFSCRSGRRALCSRSGEDVFDKYERGLVEPSGPTIQLMALRDRHPELARELK